ncbi:MAG: glycerate kinase, partial [Lachnospiraceae bacterium]|nr:glycerate kinase [Lachnospiraceae bacterium]
MSFTQSNKMNENDFAVKMLIVSDSYKGSLSTIEVAEQIKKGVRKVFPKAVFRSLPVADGGEGTVDAFVNHLGGTHEKVMVHAPDGKLIEAEYAVLKNGAAVLEMAQASGLTLVSPEERNIMSATTYGTGELIRAALDRGCRKIFIGIGGSATNDAGVGMAQALGASFKDQEGREICFGGGALGDIASFDLSGMDPRLREAEITVMCDVTNPLYGPDGAASIYGPQKGATEEL